MKFAGFEEFSSWWAGPDWLLVSAEASESKYFPNSSGVYVFVDTVSQKPIYIGQSARLNQRIKSHTHLKRIARQQQLRTIEIRILVTGIRSDVALLIEAYCINKFLIKYGILPKYNRKI